mgnify:CR=1 FL=1
MTFLHATGIRSDSRRCGLGGRGLRTGGFRSVRVRLDGNSTSASTGEHHTIRVMLVEGASHDLRRNAKFLCNMADGDTFAVGDTSLNGGEVESYVNHGSRHCCFLM